MNSTARSCPNPFSDSKAFSICRQFLLMVGIFCNSLLLYGLVKDPLKCFKNCSSYLIINNTVSDLVLCLYKFARCYWQSCNGDLFVSSLFSFPLYISFLSIFFLALDRCVIACYPFQYRAFMDGKKAVPMAVIIFQWMFAFLNIALKKFLKQLVPEFRLIGGILVLFFSCLLYLKTILHLKKEAKYLKNYCGNTSTALRTSIQRRQQRLFKQKRFLYTIICITCLLVSTLFPLLIFDMVKRIHGNDNITNKHLLHINMCFYYLFYSNFVINSFVYYIRLTNYRKTFKVLFLCQRRIVEVFS